MKQYLVPAAAYAMVAAAAGTGFAQPLTITYRNTVALPTTAVDQHGVTFTVTGLSGITRVAPGEFVLVMDNSDKLVRLTVTSGAGGTVSSADFSGGLTLAQTHDSEGIAAVGPGSRIAYVAEEDTPAVRQIDLEDGFALGALETPEVFLQRRANLGFESLTRSEDGLLMWTANEAALSVDGPLATSSVGTTVRLLRYRRDGAGYAPAEQYAYVVEPLHGAEIPGSVSGLSDLLLLPDGRLLTLERSLALGSSLFLTRIFAVDFAGATNVAALPSLVGQTYTPVHKTLLYSGSHNNLEGIGLGARTGPDRYQLLGVVDDGDPISTNALVAFEISGAGGPACYANCDGSTTSPVLNVNDFLCFQTRFTAGEWYADCDGGSAVPVLTINDFICFQTRFAAGCP